jgi:NitT/TauT family transport system ATP-binding protein
MPDRSFVDAQTREQLQDDLLKISAKTDTTVIFVTHSIDESIYLDALAAKIPT